MTTTTHSKSKPNTKSTAKSKSKKISKSPTKSISKSTSTQSPKIDTEAIRQELKIDARALGIPSGAANIFIESAIANATKSLSKKSSISHQEFSRAIIRELKNYNSDLAYVYQNRDTII